MRDTIELTRKERRLEAQARRRELELAETQAAVRRRRLARLGIVGGLVVALVTVILIATGGGGGTRPLAANSSAANQAVATVTSLVGGIPQNGNVLGDPSAPVTLQYYGDLECPVCQQFSTTGALPTLIQKWVRPGKLKIEYVALETATREPEVFGDQQVAALAAGRQDKMWQFVELFYNEQGEENSGYVTEGYLQNLARQVPGLNLQQWAAARTEAALASQVATDAQAARSAGLNGTPAFLIGRSGQSLKTLEYESLTDASTFNAAIERSLGR
jgi:protein-disulfide isomerase